MAGLLVAAVVMEHLSIPIRTIRLPVGGEIPDVYRWLAGERARRVAEVPFYGPWLNRLDSLPMYFATGSSRAIVNGYTGFYPPAYAFLRHKLSSEPGPFFLETVERLGLDTIVVHPHLWDERERPAWLAFLAEAQDRLRLLRSFPESAHRGEPAWDHGGELVYQVRRPGAQGSAALPERESSHRRQELDRERLTRTRARRSRRRDPRTDGRPATSRRPVTSWRRASRRRGVPGVCCSATPTRATRESSRSRCAIPTAAGGSRISTAPRPIASCCSGCCGSGHERWYAMDFFEPVRGNAVRLRVAQADPSLEMWRVAELQVYR